MDVAEPAWLEELVFGDLRVWQVIFLTLAAVVGLIIALCCCIRFRVPRTKQQIEADYQRRIITKKFRQQLERIQNSQMDSIDLKAALVLIGNEFKTSDDEKERPRSVSIVSSIVSPVHSSFDGSTKSSQSLHDRLECGNSKNTTQPGTFGSRLIALVRLSKQKEAPNASGIC